jgi:hypothetical protein
MCSVRGREPGLGAMKPAAPGPGMRPRPAAGITSLWARRRPEEEPLFPPIVTPTRPYPCDPSRHATAREVWARLAGRIARFVEAAIQKYHARLAVRRLREFDDGLLRGIGGGHGEIERVVARAPGRGSQVPGPIIRTPLQSKPISSIGEQRLKHWST